MGGRAGEERRLDAAKHLQGGTLSSVFDMGKHIRVRRHMRVFGIPYWHHGITTGSSEVVEFGGGTLWNKQETQVRRVPLDRFRLGVEPELVVHPIRWFGFTYSPLLPPDQVVDRAEWLLCNQPPPYQLGFRNCESIAIWCATGDFESFQVKRFMSRRVLVTLAVLPFARRWPKGFTVFMILGGIVTLLTAIPYNLNRRFFEHTRRYPGYRTGMRPEPPD